MCRRANSGARCVCRRAMFQPNTAQACPNRQASRRFVALSAERMKEWMASDLSQLDLLVIQIDGIHIEEDLVLLAAIGVDGVGDKHPLAVIEGATENAAVTQALLDNLIDAGWTPRFAVVVLPNR